MEEELVNSFRRVRRNREMACQTDGGDQLATVEADLQRIRMENFKLEKALKMLQDNVAVHAANQNNTSSSFMLPSEFKSKWEQMVKETLPNAFLSLCEHPLLMVYAVQSSCLFVHAKVRRMIDTKTKAIAVTLGIEGDSGPLAQHLAKLYQDHHARAFGLPGECLDELMAHLKAQMAACIARYSQSSEETATMQGCCDEWLDGSGDMREWLEQFWLLMLYVCLSDQNLCLGYDQVTFTFQEYRKTDYYCVDGFGKEGSPSLVVLPYVQVAQKSFSYHGLKHAVLILAPEMKDLQERVCRPAVELQQSVDLTSGALHVQDLITEHRIKPHSTAKSVVQQMKDTLDVISKLESGQSFDGCRTLQSTDRFYMQRILRTQNSRIEENSSFLGKINTSLAGKIVHQRSLHAEEPAKQTDRQPPGSSRLYKNNTRVNKENVINPDKRNSLEKLMKSFCQSQKQRQQVKLPTQQQVQAHQRAQSNENNSRTFKNLLDNFSSDEEEIPTLNRLRKPVPPVTAKLIMQKLGSRRS